jgi:outer membrane protein assembly factor BamB
VKAQLPARRALRCIPPALALSLLLTGCFAGQERPAQRDPLPPDPDTRHSIDYYQSQLIELPLRLQSYDLTGPRRDTPIVVRDLHVIHDNVRDEILVVDSDRGRNTLWSIDAYNMTLYWKTPIEQRVNFEPVATRNYVVLMNSDGEYQAYDRVSAPRANESRLAAKGRYEGNIFPSAPPAANDTHVFVPATNANAIRGFSTIHSPRGEGPETWSFPRAGVSMARAFMQVNLPPVADSETVAFVNNNQYLYMVDGLTGELRASVPLGGYSRTPPVIQDNLVFVGSDTGQLFAWHKSGDAAFVITLDGLPYGDIFVKDRWIFVRTLEVYDREIVSEDGRDPRTEIATRPGRLMAFRYELVDVPGDRPVFRVVDGNPARVHQVDPIWSQPDTGQRIMMLNGGHAYVLQERFEEFLTDREKAELRRQGRIVTRRDELRVTKRELSVIDVETGKLTRPEWRLDLMDFPYIAGSMQERDRALYLATRDGYVFKAYAPTRLAGGN